MGARFLLAAALIASFLAIGSAYYVPGTWPQEFWPGDSLQGEREGREASQRPVQAGRWLRTAADDLGGPYG